MEETSPTPGGTTVATPSEPTQPQGTAPASGEARQSAPAEENFTRVDPNSLPPQLREAYNNMLRDYKEKTTKISESVKSQVAKETEALKRKADWYDQFLQEEEAVKWWNQYAQTKSNPGTPPETEAITRLEQQLQEVQQVQLRTEMGQVADAFADAVNDKGEKQHPDFDKLNSIVVGSIPQKNGETEEYTLLRACIELSPGSAQERLANGYKKAKELHDAIFEEGRKAGLGRIQSRVLNSTQPPTGVAPNAQQVTDKVPQNAREAWELAKRGISVRRK